MANVIVGLIVVAALGLSVFGIVDAARRPQAAWDQVGQSKVLWLVLLAVSIVLDFFLFGVIISILYLAVARSKLNGVGFGGTGWGSTPYSGPSAPGAQPGAWGQAPGAYPGPSWPAANPGSPPGSTWPAANPGSTPPATPGSPWLATPDPAPAAAASPVAGWYADPGGSGQKRYWDGRAWTNELRP